MAPSTGRRHHGHGRSAATRSRRIEPGRRHDRARCRSSRRVVTGCRYRFAPEHDRDGRRPSDRTASARTSVIQLNPDAQQVTGEFILRPASASAATPSRGSSSSPTGSCHAGRSSGVKERDHQVGQQQTTGMFSGTSASPERARPRAQSRRPLKNQQHATSAAPSSRIACTISGYEHAAAQTIRNRVAGVSGVNRAVRDPWSSSRAGPITSCPQEPPDAQRQLTKSGAVRRSGREPSSQPGSTDQVRHALVVDNPRVSHRATNQVQLAHSPSASERTLTTWSHHWRAADGSRPDRRASRSPASIAGNANYPRIKVRTSGRRATTTTCHYVRRARPKSRRRISLGQEGLVQLRELHGDHRRAHGPFRQHRIAVPGSLNADTWNLAAIPPTAGLTSASARTSFRSTD
jgi:hypothetical protein